MWVLEIVTNVTFFINRIRHHPIGCSTVILPDYVKNNKSIISLEREPIHSNRYKDNLCLFRCLALHRGCNHRHLEQSIAQLYEHYNKAGVGFRIFRGVTLEELDRVEELFQTNICVLCVRIPKR